MRLFRFDDQKVNDLTMLQYQIVNYWQQKERLPLALRDPKQVKSQPGGRFRSDSGQTLQSFDQIFDRLW